MMRPPRILSMFALLLAFPPLFSACARSTAYRSERPAPEDPEALREEREEKMGKVKKFAAPKKRTVVLSFWNDTPVKGRFTKVGQASLKGALKETGSVNIVDDYKITAKSQDFYVDREKINVEELTKIGRQWAVSLIAVG